MSVFIVADPPMREGPESVDLPGHFVFHLLEEVSDIVVADFWK